MRTLILSTDPGIPLYGPSGASAHLRGLARAFAARGDVVRVAVPRLEDGRGGVDDPVPADVVTSPSRRWGFLPRSVRERGECWDGRRLLATALDGFTPDVVWERYSLFGDGGKRLGQGRVVPFDGVRVLEVDAPLSIERARYGRVLNPAFADVLERAILTEGVDRVACVSRWLADWAVSRGADPAKVVHVPNGVDDRGPGDRDGTRRRLGLDGLVVGFLGTMKPWHGVDRLPAIADVLGDATVVVAGDGPVDVPKHPRVRALGRVAPKDVADVVAAMDVGLAPYAADAPPWFCPLKVLEYRAQGVPVVGADVGDVAALLADGSGIVVRDDAPEAWADAIRRAASLPRVRRVRTWGDVIDEGLKGTRADDVRAARRTS